MPYNPSSITTQTTVLALTLTIGVSPDAPWTAGQTVTSRVLARSDTTPLAGRTIVFLVVDVETAKVKEIGRATTGSDGYATLNYTIEWSIAADAILPCGSIKFSAYDLATGYSTYNVVQGKCAYPTRISISAPSSVNAGEPFSVSGKLEYQNTATTWAALAGKTVSIYRDTTKVADATTDSSGIYSASISIPTSGTYTLKAVYAGEGLTAAAISLRGLTISPETKTALSIALPLVIGTVAFAYLKAKH